MANQMAIGRRLKLAALAGVTVLATVFGTNNVAQAQGGYVGASIGQTDYDLTGFSDTASATKLFGGYNFNKNFGIEGTWYDFGEGKDNGYTIEVDGIGFTGNGYLPLSDTFSLFGKIGLLMWDANIKPGTNDDGTDVLYGIGGQWSLNKQFALRVEYESADVSNGDGSLISVGFSYHF